MKTIVAGGRKFNNWPLMESYLKEINITELVSGAAPGADKMGEWYAKVNNIPLKQFPAEWKKFGPGAGPIRNIAMADYAEQLVAFWDGKSPGTSHMIKYFKEKYPSKPIFIVRY